MARFNFQDADNYKGSGSNFFSLKNDRDTARIRFLVNDLNDLYGVSCHEVDVNGKKVDVECLRTYDEPLDKCPLCQAGYSLSNKLFIPMYDVTTQTSKIWTRGTTYFDKMASLCSHYHPLVSTVFDIERLGKKGETTTKYETYYVETDNAKLSDFPPVELENKAFLCKDYNSMQNYVATGSFDAPAYGRAAQQPAQQQRQVPIRRAPVRNDEEAF